MRTPIVLTIAIVLIATAGAAYWWFYYDPVVSEATRTPFRYGFELRNTTSDVLREVKLEVFAPADIAGRQTVVSLDSNLPHTEVRDSHGNRTLSFSLLIPPYGLKSIVVSGEVELWSPSLATPVEDEQVFLREEPKVEVSHPDIALVAQNIADRQGDIAVNTAQFVYERVKDVGYLVEDRGALYALNEKNGDCTEFMSLFTALARANDIPTRRLAGFLVNPDGARLGSSNYHNWAEYYDGKRWVLVDAQRNVVNDRQPTYLSFRVLTQDSQLSTTQRFFSSDARVNTKLL